MEGKGGIPISIKLCHEKNNNNLQNFKKREKESYQGQIVKGQTLHLLARCPCVIYRMSLYGGSTLWIVHCGPLGTQSFKAESISSASPLQQHSTAQNSPGTLTYLVNNNASQNTLCSFIY